MKVVLLLVFVTFAYAKIGGSNNEDAETPEDVMAFRAMHEDDTCVLFFHDGADAKETGFFESIFGIFGTKDIDEEYQRKLAEKFPTLEIDKNIRALQNVSESYEVPDLPYIIAYNKGREVWREMPSKDTPEIIENLVRSQNNTNIQLYPQMHTPVFQNRTSSTSSGSYGNQTRSSYQNRTSSRPVVQAGRHRSPYAPIGNSRYNDTTDPFFSSRYSTLNNSRTYEEDYGHLYWQDEFAGRPRVVYNTPSAYNVPEFTVPTYAPSNRRVVRDGLQAMDAYWDDNTSSRSLVKSGYTNQSTSDKSGARNQSTASRQQASNDWSTDNSYGPAEIQQGLTVRKYDADRGRI